MPISKGATGPKHSIPASLHRIWRPLWLAGLLLHVAAAPLHAAGLKLASLFSDHMVLQRDRADPVWGNGEPGAAVAVKIGSQSVASTVGADGHWRATLQPMPAGGPFRLSVSSGDKTIAIDDVLIGDIWLCSGQSNMQLPLKECRDGEALGRLLEQSPKLRLCTVAKGWNKLPQASADIKWRAPTPDAVRGFSAVACCFAIELLKGPELADVPVGVIDCSFGGTTCEGWVPNAALAKFDPAELHDSMFGIKPGMLYNAMIAPLGTSPIRGVVWYQGESNAERPGTYAQLLSTMIAEWRKQFDSPELPFVVVQLPDYALASNGLHWQWIREAQAKAVAKTAHTALALGINTTDGFDLHPKAKLEIGRRAALLARHDFYGEDIAARGPVFKEARIEASSVRVTFDTSGDGLTASVPGAIRGFALAGDDGQYRFADAEIAGDSVILRCEQVPAPKTVRHAWAGIPGSTLTDKSGLPAAPFRTDDLPPDGIEVQKQPAVRHLSTPSYEITIGGDGQITSLGVRGRQFISNALGAAGGTSIPVLFGARALANIREIGPDLLSCSDGEVTLLLAFKPNEMEWTLTNHAKDPITFRIALSGQVAVSGGADGQPIRLTRGKSVLLVSGVGSVTNGEDGNVLETVVKGGGTEKQLELKVEPQ